MGEHKKYLESSIETKVESDKVDNLTPSISQISLESVLNKETAETIPNTQNWSAL
jgi:hypothetical protein